MTGRDRIVVSCEHGGNRIPQQYRALFQGGEPILQTHRGYDAGALSLARDFTEALGIPLFAATVSRLLIDLNRSRGHPRLYSEFTRHTPVATRREILQQYYQPYRSQVETHIAQFIANGHRVIHLSCHTFTPILDGEVRHTDFGLLYDPARKAEAAFCLHWRKTLHAHAPTYRTRMNYPYSGKSDAFMVPLRRRFTDDSYLGIELEVNQKHVSGNSRRWRDMRAFLVAAFQDAVAAMRPER